MTSVPKSGVGGLNRSKSCLKGGLSEVPLLSWLPVDKIDVSYVS